MSATKKFIKGVSRKTGLSPSVVSAWVTSEGGPSDNPLNIGPGQHFGSTKGAVKATSKLIKSPSYSGITSSTRGSDKKQINAIVQSSWCPGCAGYKDLLTGVYNSQGPVNIKSTTPKKPKQMKSPAKMKQTAPATPAKLDPATLLAFIQKDDKTAADYIGLSQEKAALASTSQKPEGFGKEKPVEASLKKGGPVSNKGIVGWAERQVNTQEGSGKQVRWAKNVGVSASLPWCSVFVANALRKNGVKHLPSNPAYSGAWLDWKGGKKVSSKHIKKGDIVVFDWGDGGITDHVAIYAGNGQVIGGNQSNAVTKVPLSKGNIVGVVRPK